MATDLCILALPWIIFRNLEASRARKYGVRLLCSVGVFTLLSSTLLSSTLRLPYLRKLNISEDLTWHVVDICIWSIAELGSAITLTCIPAIMPLIKHYFPLFMASNTGMTIHWIPETNSQAHTGMSSEGTATVNKDNSTTCL